MDHYEFLAGMSKFGATPEEICLNTLGINADRIRETAIISPGWLPERLFAKHQIKEVMQSSPLFQYKIWDIEQDGTASTYIKTGFGAPVVMDCLLLLGLTGRCKKIVFVSSVGGLTDEINVGDIVLPEYSACGDGAGRYLSDDLGQAPFGEKQYPHPELFAALVKSTQEICKRHNVRWHSGKTFCVDTIIAQHHHLPKIVDAGYNSIDMESAITFKVASIFGIPAVGILNVSDNSAKEGKTLISKRAPEEKAYRRFVAREVIPQIIKEVIHKST